MNYVFLVCASVLLMGCQQSLPETIVGERDAHGCLASEGYLFDEQVGACTQGLELDDEQKSAVRAVVDRSGDGVTVLDVSSVECPGCFDIRYERDGVVENVLVRDNIVVGDDLPSNSVRCTSRSEMCTTEYDPVCANLITGERLDYSNACVACADRGVIAYTPGECYGRVSLS